MSPSCLPRRCQTGSLWALGRLEGPQGRARLAGSSVLPLKWRLVPSWAPFLVPLLKTTQTPKWPLPGRGLTLTFGSKGLQDPSSLPPSQLLTTCVVSLSPAQAWPARGLQGGPSGRLAQGQALQDHRGIARPRTWFPITHLLIFPLLICKTRTKHASQKAKNCWSPRQALGKTPSLWTSLL